MARVLGSRVPYELGETLQRTGQPDAPGFPNPNDLIQGYGGPDIIFGGDGNDVLYGNFDPSRTTNWTTTPEIFAPNDGADSIFAGIGDDSLFGGVGDDFLYGEQGTDSLSGEGGNDLVNGGAGNDILTGGSGADTFEFIASVTGTGIDLVTDYNQAEGDILDLHGLLGLGKGQSAANLVRVVGTPNQAELQFDQDGAANGVNWTTVARISGVHAGDTVKVVVDTAVPAAPLAALTSSVTETFGQTKLMQVANTFTLLANNNSSGPQLSFNGAAVTVGQFGGWAPIGVEQTPGGDYQVAWKLGADQYVIWNVDNHGNYLSQGSVVSGSSYALQSRESDFGQDLNGDAILGLAQKITIETSGATDLARVPESYVLLAEFGLKGPQLSYFGALVGENHFSGWTPIGAEKVGDIYQVAWKSAANQFLIWNVDGAGNYLSQGNVMSGSSFALQWTEENVLKQDLNLDGTTGLVTTQIEMFGQTKLLQVADSYSLVANDGSTGAQLRFNGAAVAAGQFGTWAPIAAEQTAFGYQVVWKSSIDQYVIWNVDHNGNYLSQGSVETGSSYALQSRESDFAQDLNKDSIDGPIKGLIETAGSTDMVTMADTYFLLANGGPAGPQLKYLGAPVTAGQFGPWAPIGAEQTGAGYQVAWKSGADQYVIWNVDGSGNYLSQGSVVSGGSFALQSREAFFQQNLNGDGTTGLVTTVLETAGATDLARVADTYFLFGGGGSSGPQLSYFGAPVTVGQFGGWAPIGAEQTGGAYHVAWKSGADQYVIWSVDGNGNWLSQGSIVSGGSFALQSSETVFQQDLNGDGLTGPSSASPVMAVVGDIPLPEQDPAWLL